MVRQKGGTPWIILVHFYIISSSLPIYQFDPHVAGEPAVSVAPQYRAQEQDKEEKRREIRKTASKVGVSEAQKLLVGLAQAMAIAAMVSGGSGR